jgi:hypothetical protein
MHCLGFFLVQSVRTVAAVSYDAISQFVQYPMMQLRIIRQTASAERPTESRSWEA